MLIVFFILNGVGDSGHYFAESAVFPCLVLLKLIKAATDCMCRSILLLLTVVGWTLHFVLGPSLADKHVRIFVNHPADAHAGPNRHVYRELTWMNMSGIQSDCFDNFAEVVLVLSGSFNYYFTINDRYDSVTRILSFS